MLPVAHVHDKLAVASSTRRQLRQQSFFAVVQSRLFNQSLFEFVQIIDTNLVYTLLHDAPNLVVFGSVRGCLAATDQYSDEVGGIALQQLSGLTGAEGQRAISICYYRSLIN